MGSWHSEAVTERACRQCCFCAYFQPLLVIASLRSRRGNPLYGFYVSAKNKGICAYGSPLVLPRGFHLGLFSDLTMLFFIFFNTVPDQNENLTVGGTSLIIRNHVKSIQHFFIDPDRKTFDSHTITSLRTYFMSNYVTMGNNGTKIYLKYVH